MVKLSNTIGQSLNVLINVDAMNHNTGPNLLSHHLITCMGCSHAGSSVCSIREHINDAIDGRKMQELSVGAGDSAFSRLRPLFLRLLFPTEGGSDSLCFLGSFLAAAMAVFWSAPSVFRG